MFSTDDEKYQALVDRDPCAEGLFVYCVRSTKIVCRPTCSSRLAKRQNVEFYPDVANAIMFCYRPCKRCKPDFKEGWNSQREIIKRGCELIYRRSASNKALNIDEILQQLQVSKWYFYRTFKMYMLMTPRQYYLNCKCTTTLEFVPLQTKKNAQRQKILLDSLVKENDDFLQSLVDPMFL